MSELKGEIYDIICHVISAFMIEFVGNFTPALNKHYAYNDLIYLAI